MVKITGSCLCGQLHYAGDTEIMGAMSCHCDQCRKATGAIHSTNVFVADADITVTGETLEFEHTSDSGSTMTKINCAKCGSPTLGRNTNRPTGLTIRAGTLDQKELIQPGGYVYCENAIPSTVMDPALKQFDKMPG
jgi:hypothetical protein